MAAAIAVATPNAAAGQDLTPRAIAPQRFLVREPDGAIPGRRALLDQIHAEVRAGGTDLDTRIRALESAGAAARDALRSAVARHGGRVEKTSAVSGGASAVVPPAALDA